MGSLHTLSKYINPGFYRNYFRTGHERSIRAKKNIAALLFRKGLGVIISILMVPLLIDFLNPERYGIWLTLSSFIAWFNFLDIGLGNGLRNRFAEAMAIKKLKLARIYVSTSYAFIGIISLGLLFVFLFASEYINWNKVFNAPAEYTLELKAGVQVAFSFFCLQFFIKLINTILTADQKPALAGYFNTISSLLVLLTVWLIKMQASGTLVLISYVTSISNFIVPAVASIWLFSKAYRHVSPRFSFVRFSVLKDILSLGVQFFLIQLSAIIIYSISNMIISQLFSPEQVTPYQVAFKYFSVLTMFFAIVVTPFWSAITEANVKQDFDWIRKIMGKLVRIWVLMMVLVIFMVIVSPYVYKLWVGGKINVPFQLSVVMGGYTALIAWNTIFASYLNGLGKLRVQLYSAFFGAALYIPMAIILAKKLGLGITGIALTGLILNLISAIWSPWQYYLLINKKATGIWNK